jgi:hypothetical protein
VSRRWYADFVGWADLTGVKLLAVETDAQKKRMLQTLWF